MTLFLTPQKVGILEGDFSLIRAFGGNTNRYFPRRIMAIQQNKCIVEDRRE